MLFQAQQSCDVVSVCRGDLVVIVRAKQIRITAGQRMCFDVLGKLLRPLPVRGAAVTFGPPRRDDLEHEMRPTQTKRCCGRWHPSRRTVEMMQNDTREGRSPGISGGDQLG